MLLKLLKITFFFLFCLLIILYVWGRFYENHHKLLVLIGKKGSGKTTISCMFAIKHLLQGKPVFSDSPIFGCYKLEKDWCGRNDFPDDSLIIWDEGLIEFDNRKFKSFDDNLRNFFVMQRHDRVSVIVLCQDFLLDRKIRALTDSIYVVVNYMNVISVGKKVHKGIALATDSEGQGSIGESYTWEFPTSWIWCFIPRWVSFFDSFRKEEKPKVPLIKYEFENPDQLEKLMFERYWYQKTIRKIIHFCIMEIKMWRCSDGVYWMQNLHPSLRWVLQSSF